MTPPPPYAHSCPSRNRNGWEPLFTAFGEEPAECQRDRCETCKNLDPHHGHLNKVAYWTARFAAEMFPPGSADAQSVFIPWGEKGKALEEELRKLVMQGRSPNRSHYRRAQQFTVQVYEHESLTLKPSLTLLFDEAIAILIHPENEYDKLTGLKRSGTASDPNAFCL